MSESVGEVCPNCEAVLDKDRYCPRCGLRVGEQGPGNPFDTVLIVFLFIVLVLPLAFLGACAIGSEVVSGLPKISGIVTGALLLAASVICGFAVWRAALRQR